MTPLRISDLAVGEVFHDAIPQGDDFVLRFQSGLEILVAWASSGPEVKDWTNRGMALRDLTTGGMHKPEGLHPQFQYVTGKTVELVLTDGRDLILRFTDGHELRSSFRRQPEAVAVDARIILKPSLMGVGGKAN